MAGKKYDGNLFNPSKAKNKILHKPNIDPEKLIQMQAQLLVDQFGSSCLNTKQLKQIFGVGESNIYELLKNPDFPVITIGNRKVVSPIALAAWMFKHSSE